MCVNVQCVSLDSSQFRFIWHKGKGGIRKLVSTTFVVFFSFMGGESTERHCSSTVNSPASGRTQIVFLWDAI